MARKRKSRSHQSTPPNTLIASPKPARQQPVRYHPLPDFYKRPPITDYVNPLPWPEVADSEAPMSQDETDEMRRLMATNLFLLPVICEEPACRRARFCAVRHAPCIFRYKHIYHPHASEVYRALVAVSGGNR